jgi:hypothetical protein
MNFNKLIWKVFFLIKYFFEDFSKNILKIFPQKQSQKQ